MTKTNNIRITNGNGRMGSRYELLKILLYVI